MATMRREFLERLVISPLGVLACGEEPLPQKPVPKFVACPTPVLGYTAERDNYPVWYDQNIKGRIIEVPPGPVFVQPPSYSSFFTTDELKDFEERVLDPGAQLDAEAVAAFNGGTLESLTKKEVRNGVLLFPLRLDDATLTEYEQRSALTFKNLVDVTGMGACSDFTIPRIQNTFFKGGEVQFAQEPHSDNIPYLVVGRLAEALEGDYEATINGRVVSLTRVKSLIDFAISSIPISRFELSLDSSQVFIVDEIYNPIIFSLGASARVTYAFPSFHSLEHMMRAPSTRHAQQRVQSFWESSGKPFPFNLAFVEEVGNIQRTWQRNGRNVAYAVASNYFLEYAPRVGVSDMGDFVDNQIIRNYSGVEPLLRQLRRKEKTPLELLQTYVHAPEDLGL